MVKLVRFVLCNVWAFYAKRKAFFSTVFHTNRSFIKLFFFFYSEYYKMK